MASLDLIIISDAKSEHFRSLTDNAIKTAVDNETEFDVNVIVVEKQQIYYPSSMTVHQWGKFNYNAYCNMGAEWGSSEYIAFCNNDLIFGENWASKIIEGMNKVGAVSGCAYCPASHVNSHIKPYSGIYEGYQIRKEFCGWAFIMRRDYWKDNPLDERLVFWASDNATSKSLLNGGKKHVLVSDAIIEHIGNGSATLFSLPNEERQALMHEQVKVYNRLYSDNVWGLGTD